MERFPLFRRGNPVPSRNRANLICLAIWYGPTPRYCWPCYA